MRRADRILTVSEATAADLGRHLGVAADAVTVIWNGVDERFREPLAEEAVRSELAALALAPGYFLFVGNPKPHKNLERLLAFNASRGIKTLFVLEANCPEGFEGPPEEWLLDDRLFKRHSEMKAVAARHGVPVLDLHERLRRGATLDSGLLWCDFVHLTPYGQKLFAEAVFESLRPLL